MAREAAQGQRVEPQEVGRDLKGARDALEPTSAPGALDARFDAGVFFHYDVMTALARETVGQFVGQSDVLAAGGANTSNSLTFQIGQDHVLMQLQVEAVSNTGNIDTWGVTMQPVGSNEIVLLGRAAQSNQLIRESDGTARVVLLPHPEIKADFPIWVREETLYHLTIDTNGGGDAEIQSRQWLTRTPDGVEIPAP